MACLIECSKPIFERRGMWNDKVLQQHLRGDGACLVKSKNKEKNGLWLLKIKFPGKDITEDDLKNKVPLAAKQSPDHKTVIDVAGVKVRRGYDTCFCRPEYG